MESISLKYDHIPLLYVPNISPSGQYYYPVYSTIAGCPLIVRLSAPAWSCHNSGILQDQIRDVEKFGEFQEGTKLLGYPTSDWRGIFFCCTFKNCGFITSELDDIYEHAEEKHGVDNPSSSKQSNKTVHFDDLEPSGLSKNLTDAKNVLIGKFSCEECPEFKGSFEEFVEHKTDHHMEFCTAPNQDCP